jgi:hypothetical protein
MVEHVQPGLDRAPVTPFRSARRRRDSIEGVFEWAAAEMLPFIVVALFFIGTAVTLPQQLFQDTWMVVLGGREIVEHGLPARETLTIWTHSREWVDQQWLAQVLFYGLFALGGIKAVLWAHLVATTAAFALAVVVARRRGGSSASVCWIALAVYLLLSWGAWNARAQSFALLLFVCVAALLIRDAHAQSRRVFFVIPLLILWANIHGTALTGAVLVALWGVTYAYERRRRPRAEWLPRAAALIALPLASVFASPYAAHLPGYYSTMLFNSGFRDFVIEWRPTAPSLQTAPFYLLAFLTVWLVGRQKDRLLPFEKVLLAVTLLMGLQAMRSVIWFALVALMLVPAALDGVLEPSSVAARHPSLSRLVVGTGVVAVVATLAIVATKPSGWFDRTYPAGALTALDRAQARDPQMRVLADAAYADWLLLRRPELRGRIAFDIRFELMSKTELRRLVDVMRATEGSRRVIAPYSLFVLKRGVESPLTRALVRDRRARVLFRGHGVVVISRPIHVQNA